jgi:hypothetical protein
MQLSNESRAGWAEIESCCWNFKGNPRGLRFRAQENVCQIRALRFFSGGAGFPPLARPSFLHGLEAAAEGKGVGGNIFCNARRRGNVST